MYRQEKEDATKCKTLKHAGYKSKEKGSSVDAWSEHPNLQRRNTLTNIRSDFTKLQCDLAS